MVISDESGRNRAKNFIQETICAERYGLWEYNSICLQGTKEHMGSEGRVISKGAGV